MTDDADKKGRTAAAGGEGGGAPDGPGQRCRHCGSELAPAAVFCKACERYQPDEGDDPAHSGPRTMRCRFCSEWIPAGAKRCNHCESFQEGYRSVLPLSAATVSALAALVSVVVLLFNTVTSQPEDPSSETRVELFDADSLHLYMRVVNTGNAPSFVGTGWMKVARECDWSDDNQPALCGETWAEPPRGVIQLKVDRRDGNIPPGARIVSFERKGSLAAADRPEPDFPWCEGARERIAELDLCLVFEVLEHQEGGRRCSYHSVREVNPQHYRPLVEGALCG